MPQIRSSPAEEIELRRAITYFQIFEVKFWLRMGIDYETPGQLASWVITLSLSLAHVLFPGFPYSANCEALL